MPLDLFDLTGKHALITGGTSGIGLAISRCFSAAGPKVVVVSNRENDCANARAEGLTAQCIELGSCKTSDALVGEVGPVDILVANAGVEGPVGPTGACDEEAYLKTFDINLHAVYWLAGRRGRSDDGWRRTYHPDEQSFRRARQR